MKRLKDGFQGERHVVLPPMVIQTLCRDSLTASLYVTDIGYYPSAAHHYRKRLQPISQYVLIYCVSGSGWYRLAGKEHQVAQSQCFVLPPDVPHSYGTTDGASWTIYWLHFGGHHAPIYAEGMQTPQNIRVAANSRIMDRISIFEEMLSTLQRGCGLEELRYVSSLLHHFLASMRYLGQFRASHNEVLDSIARTTTPQASPASNDTSGRAVCQAAIHFMQENIENHITLQDVVRYTGYSQSHLSALFKSQAHTSPLAYFNRLKIERACQLLTDTDLNINQICHKVGIHDPYYFSRLFKQLTGQSPKAYRLTALPTSPTPDGQPL